MCSIMPPILKKIYFFSQGSSESRESNKITRWYMIHRPLWYVFLTYVAVDIEVDNCQRVSS